MDLGLDMDTNILNIKCASVNVKKKSKALRVLNIVIVKKKLHLRWY